MLFRKVDARRRCLCIFLCPGYTSLTLLQEKDYDSYVTVIEGNRRYIIPKERLIGIDFHSLAYLKLTQEKLEELQRGFKELFRDSPLSKEFQRSKAL